jgi:iron complex transport system substrate-binding protein
MSRLFVFLLLACAAVAAGAADFVDDSGRRHAFAAPPQRVATLAPSLTELVFAAGAGARIVATVQHSNHPPPARAIEVVGDYERVDVERLLRLKPDAVLVWSSGNSQRELAQLTAAGVPVVHLEPRRLDDVARAIERLGDLFGTRDEAQRAARALRDELAVLAREHSGKTPVRVFYQVWSRPLLTLNDQHLIGDVIALCGGRNVFGALKTLVPEVSTESVLAARPEVIFAARESAPGESSQARREPQAASLEAWQPFRASLVAARRGWMFTLPGDQISRQGPRIAGGARALCGALDEVRRERDAKAPPQR